ncbi:MAG: hypothetical protein ABII07_02020 [Patescibacteria group bacterium]|nr:hypothetical protein [Patescibacteria group bacterium]
MNKPELKKYGPPQNEVKAYIPGLNTLAKVQKHAFRFGLKVIMEALVQSGENSQKTVVEFHNK